MVALRKESVDRNIFISYTIDNESRSLSARRAWIEIYCWRVTIPFRPVALRKESVDRNIMYVGTGPAKCQSLSARRAWIEMVSKSALMVFNASLSARRAWIEIGCCPGP